MDIYEDKRNYKRFPTQLKGTFLLKGGLRREQCTVLNVSRKGLGVAFHTKETISRGSSVYIEIYPPQELQPISVKGVVKWITQIENGYTGGVELMSKFDDAVLSKLM